MSSNIETFENAIVTAITAAFTAPKPYITADIDYEADPENKEKLFGEASRLAVDSTGNAVIFVAYVNKDFGDKRGGLYYPFYMYTIQMFAKNRRKTGTAHVDIYTMLETVELAMFKNGYQLFRDNNLPVRVNKYGLYWANLLIGKHKAFPHTQVT